MYQFNGAFREAAGAATPFPGVATISAEHALAEAKRGAARASLALAVMAPPQDAPAALMTAAELAADAEIAKLKAELKALRGDPLPPADYGTTQV